MSYTVEQIAAALGAQAYGDLSISITGAAEPAIAGPDDLALALSPAFVADLASGDARAAVITADTDWQTAGLQAAIVAPRGRLAMAGLTRMLDAQPAFPALGDSHPSSVTDGAWIGAQCSIGPFTHIAAGARIDAGARIASHVSIGAGTVIGENATIHAGARIGAGVTIGTGVTIQSGAVIGGDGFSFVTEGLSGPEQAKARGGSARLTPPDHAAWHKIHSLGGVEIGDDVEIGANSTIDAGTIRATRIGRGTKIDNLVHIGHNVTVGEDCLLCGQTGIAGSVVIGNRVVLAGQTGVGDHHTIGDDVVTGAGTMILSNVPAGKVLLGYPAQRMDQSIASYKALRRLTRKPVSGK